jgi:hypothetical protein
MADKLFTMMNNEETAPLAVERGQEEKAEAIRF